MALTASTLHASQPHPHRFPSQPGPSWDAVDPGGWARRVSVQDLSGPVPQARRGASAVAQPEPNSRALGQRTLRRIHVPILLGGVALGGVVAVGSVVGGVAADNPGVAIVGGMAGMLTLMTSGIGLGCSALVAWCRSRRAAQAWAQVRARQAGESVWPEPSQQSGQGPASFAEEGPGESAAAWLHDVDSIGGRTPPDEIPDVTGRPSVAEPLSRAPSATPTPTPTPTPPEEA